MEAKIYKAFLASPSDTEQERLAAEKVVSDINTTLGERHSFILKLLKWENDSFPAFGEDGQDVINKQLGNDYHFFISIMWKKFGSPTKRAASGTEEEFNRAYERYQKDCSLGILCYFNGTPLPQDGLDVEQYQKVQDFKARVKGLGSLYAIYNSLSDFESQFRTAITKHLFTLIDRETKPLQNGASHEQELFPEISDAFAKYLDDPAVNFSHSKVDHISLSDIYVSPDFRERNEKIKSRKYNTENLESLSAAIEATGISYGFVGNESCGKTSAAKYLFSNYFNLGLLPVFINGSEITSNIRIEHIRKLAEEKIAEQYKQPFKLDHFHTDRYLVIIDDFQKSAKGNNKYWHALMHNVKDVFRNVIVTGSPLMIIESITRKNPFEGFRTFTFLDFGPSLRSALVNKWYSLGIDERYFDKNELLRKHDNAIVHIKTIIGKNYIPVYPFYLLTILQALESGNAQNPNYSIHGFYYELIISDALNRAVKDKKEISLFYNYLTSFCFFLFEQKKKELTIDEFRSFHQLYCEKHDLTYSFELIIRTLDQAKLLAVDQRVYPKEKFIYYFFVAKYIANSISRTSTREVLSKMIARIFKDEYAGIVMFVTHLSKDDFVINELLDSADKIFIEAVSSRLEEDIVAVNTLVRQLPEKVLEQVEVEQKRKEQLEEEEQIEREAKEREFDTETRNYDAFSLEGDVGQIDLFAKITLALKTVDILGQVIKKHWGEIEGGKKLSIVLAIYNLGLRTLGVYLNLVQSNANDIIDHISEIVSERHIKDRYELKELIKEVAQDYVFNLCFLSSWGITKRISNSLSYDKLKKTFEKALTTQPSNAVKLIDLSIKMGYGGIPIDEVQDYSVEMKHNHLCFVLLQNLMVDHMYMFDTEYQLKDKVCSLLNISHRDQIKIDVSSKTKRR